MEIRTLTLIIVLTFVFALAAKFAPSLRKRTRWWNPDNAHGCVAAYQAMDAFSALDAKVNLANPGTYNLAGEATWDASYGWRFVAPDLGGR